MALSVLVMGCSGWPFTENLLILPLDSYISLSLGPLPCVFLSQATSILPSFRSTIWSILYVVLQRIPSSIDPHSSKNTLCYYFFFLSLLFWNHFPKKLPAPRFLSQGAFQCNLDCNILFLCFSGKRTLATQKIDRERESNVESHRLPKYHQIHDEWCVIKDTRTLVDKSFDLFK